MDAGRARPDEGVQRVGARTVLVALIACLGFLVVLVASASGPVDVGRVPPPATTTTIPGTSAPPISDSEPSETPNAAPGVFEIPNNDFVAAIVGVLLIVLLVSVVRALITMLSDLFLFLRQRSRPTRTGMVVLPEVDARRVVLDIEAQLSALSQGQPRNAIVACWLQLEEDVAAAGHPRRAAETSAEFTARVLTSLSLDPAPITQLAALYREARFSSHPMEQADRELALDLLRRVHAALAPMPAVDV